MMSALPSPLKSPTCTSTQVAAVLQNVHSEVVKELPSDKPTHQAPVFASRAAMSVSPSPLKSPVSTSTQVTVGSHVENKRFVNALDPLDALTHYCRACLTRPTTSSAGSALLPISAAVEWIGAAAPL